MDTTNSPQIILHTHEGLNFTPFEAKWVPHSARFIVLGQNPRATGALAVYELERGKVVDLDICIMGKGMGVQFRFRLFFPPGLEIFIIIYQTESCSCSCRNFVVELIFVPSNLISQYDSARNSRRRKNRKGLSVGLLGRRRLSRDILPPETTRAIWRYGT